MIYSYSSYNVTFTPVALEDGRVVKVPDYGKDMFLKKSEAKDKDDDYLKSLSGYESLSKDLYELKSLIVETSILTFGIFPLIFLPGMLSAKHKQKRADKIDIIRVPANEFSIFKDKIKEKVLELIKNKRKFYVVIDGDNADLESDKRGEEKVEYSYKPEKLLEIIDFNNELKSLGMKHSIHFNEFIETKTVEDLNHCLNLEQVIKANVELDEIVNTIREKQLSPFETMVYIHKYLTSQFDYGFIKRENQTDYNTVENRNIYTALKHNKTVCVGFASLTKAIIDKLNMPGLQCVTQTVSVASPGDIGGHILCLVDIQDEKYDIHGRYAEDPTWDNKTKEFPHGRGYAAFMYPIEDLFHHVVNMDIVPSEGSRVRSFSSHYFYGYPSVQEIDCEKSRHSEHKNELELKTSYDADIIGDSKLISLEKIKRAIKAVYSKEQKFLFDKTIEESIEDEIEASNTNALLTFDEDSLNVFIEELKKTHNITYTRREDGFYDINVTKKENETEI